MSAPINEVSVKTPAGFNTIVGVTTFTYDPRAGVTKRLGDHVLVIPGGAVCRIGTSGYGPEFWDKPCTPSNRSIVFTATTFNDADGHPYINFQPAVRFSPDKEVDIYLKDGKRDHASELAIRWCNDAGICVNEALTDASLETRRVGSSSILFRRIKHFSGYLAWSEGECNGTATPIDGGMGGWWCDDGRGESRSGYMLASGLSKGGTSGVRRGKKYDQ